MDKAGILLQIEVFEKGRWKTIEKLNLVGEAKFERIAIQIPEQFLKSKELKVRLRSGFKFWEINDFEVASANSEGITVEEFDAQVLNNGLEKKSETLKSDDNDYLIHKEGEAPIVVKFEGIKTKQNRTLFLKSKGYYKTNQNFEGKPNWGKLIAINRKGGLSRYSKEKHDDWLQLMNTLSEFGIDERVNVK
jgi:ribosomal protein L35AE/L33A